MSEENERILFVTGKLAETSLRNVLESIEDRPFSYEIVVVGVSVAALITTSMLAKRLPSLSEFDRVILPGRVRGDIAALADARQTPMERGPEEVKDLSAYLGGKEHTFNLDSHDVLVFAEIVDAPFLPIDDVLSRARYFLSEGANVIDIGCLPDTPFPHLAETITALREQGIPVSVDSLSDTDLLCGIKAGANYVFSLSSKSLSLAEEGDFTPILIGDTPNDLDSLCKTVEEFAKFDRPFFADPILDPLHLGFTASVTRYHTFRQRYPKVEMLMGIGNLSELTHADSMGINTLLVGIASELRIRALLTTQVSKHCVSAIREIDRARRIMHAAREHGTPPQNIDDSLLAIHERKPFPYQSAEIEELARAVKDPNYRIQVSDEGIHIYNRDGHHRATDPYDLFPELAVEGDHGHAFYLGLELAKAEIAWSLGKRYNQDEALRWGAALEAPEEDKQNFAPERSTLKARRNKKKKS
ncbi:MAG: DUF6513 domain-containing protein [Pseudomonadota bacterium]